MTATFVEFNRFHVGQAQLDAKLVTPNHKKQIESCLSNYISKHPTSTKKISLDVSKNPELAEVARIVRYYQHMGLLSEKAITPEDADIRHRTTRATVRAMQMASIPGSNGQLIAGVRIADDSLSLTRSILRTIPAIGPDDPVVNHLGYYAGVLWSFFSVREICGAIDDLDKAKEIADGEGKRRAQARLASGGLVASASFAYLAGRFCDTLGIVSTADNLLGMANGLFGLGSLLFMGTSSLGWVRCNRFNERLNEYLENPNFSEVEKLQGALRFLKETITVTVEEIDNLRAAIQKEHPELSTVEKEKLLQKRMTDLIEVKVKYLKRRTSNKSLQLIINQVDPLLAKLANEKTRPEAIKQATILIQKIQNENRIKMALYILGCIASAIGFIAMLVGSIVAAGPLQFVLYGISGAIYLATSIYNAAGMFKRDDADITLHPTQALDSQQNLYHLGM